MQNNTTVDVDCQEHSADIAYDAWVLARALSDQPLNGELAGMSDELRPVAETLVGTVATDRATVFKGLLDDWDDPDVILNAVAAADPLGPAPAVTVQPQGGVWPALSLPALPSVEQFPLHVLPHAAARLAVEGSEAIGCPPDFLGLPLLTVAGGAIGRSVSLRLKPDYFVSACIYSVCIGPPSDGKTPGLTAVTKAIRSIDSDLVADHDLEMQRWHHEHEGKSKKEKENLPPPPRPRRIVVDDTTMEVIPMILSDSPRGLIMIRDELSALLLGMNQYKGGKGNDRAILLKIWSGDQIIKDRVKDENRVPTRCQHPFLNIIGGMTPDMLESLTDPRGRADGFIDRFLPVYPDSMPIAGWSEKGIPDEVGDEWRCLVARLWARPLGNKDGLSVPRVAYFTPAGQARWKQRYGEHTAEMNADDFPAFLRGPWGKLRDYAGRLALILALMHHAADETANSVEVPSVDSERVDGAWDLIAYFKSHIRRVQAAIAAGPESNEQRTVKRIVSWIVANGQSTFGQRDLAQGRRSLNEAELAAGLGYLIRHGAIRLREARRPGRKGGRPSLPSYDVNPALLDTQNP